jgi:CHAT domain-containing protein
VHLVTHGVLDHLSPAFSFIVADGHPLFSFDFFDCELTTKLLILNTCSSASGGFYGGSPGASPLRIAVAGGVEIGVGNLFPVETGLATRFGFAFQKAIASGECSASAFTKALFAIKEDKDNVASFALVGRSPESLFSSGWTQRLLHKAQERVTN